MALYTEGELINKVPRGCGHCLVKDPESHRYVVVFYIAVQVCLGVVLP